MVEYIKLDNDTLQITSKSIISRQQIDDNLTKITTQKQKEIDEINEKYAKPIEELTKLSTEINKSIEK